MCERSRLLFNLKPRIVRAEGMNSFVLTVQATKPKAAAKPKTTKPKAKTAAKPKKVRLVRTLADLQAVRHCCCSTCSNSDRRQCALLCHVLREAGLEVNCFMVLTSDKALQVRAHCRLAHVTDGFQHATACSCAGMLQAPAKKKTPTKKAAAPKPKKAAAPKPKKTTATKKKVGASAARPAHFISTALQHEDF